MPGEPPSAAASHGIRTARLLLRHPLPGDEHDLVLAANDPRVAANLRDRFPHPYTLEAGRAWVAATEPDALRWLMVAEGRVIGGIGVEPGADVHRFDAELGFWLGVDHWGLGYATEAVSAVCDFVFAATRLQRLHAVVFDGNPASDRVLDKCGFVLEGTHRRAIFKNGRFLDCRIYARLKA